MSKSNSSEKGAFPKLGYPMSEEEYESFKKRGGLGSRESGPCPVYTPGAIFLQTGPFESFKGNVLDPNGVAENRCKVNDLKRAQKETHNLIIKCMLINVLLGGAIITLLICKFW